MGLFDWLEYRRRAFESADKVNELTSENDELLERLAKAETQRDEAITRSLELARKLVELAGASPAPETTPLQSQTIESQFDNGRSVVHREMAASIRKISEELAERQNGHN